MKKIKGILVFFVLILAQSSKASFASRDRDYIFPFRNNPIRLDIPEAQRALFIRHSGKIKHARNMTILHRWLGNEINHICLVEIFKQFNERFETEEARGYLRRYARQILEQVNKHLLKIEFDIFSASRFLYELDLFCSNNRIRVSSVRSSIPELEPFINKFPLVSQNHLREESDLRRVFKAYNGFFGGLKKLGYQYLTFDVNAVALGCIMEFDVERHSPETLKYFCALLHSLSRLKLSKECFPEALQRKLKETLLAALTKNTFVSLYDPVNLLAALGKLGFTKSDFSSEEQRILTEFCSRSDLHREVREEPSFLTDFVCALTYMRLPVLSQDQFEDLERGCYSDASRSSLQRYFLMFLYEGRGTALPAHFDFIPTMSSTPSLTQKQLAKDISYYIHLFFPENESITLEHEAALSLNDGFGRSLKAFTVDTKITLRTRGEKKYVLYLECDMSRVHYVYGDFERAVTAKENLRNDLIQKLVDIKNANSRKTSYMFIAFGENHIKLRTRRDGSYQARVHRKKVPYLVFLLNQLVKGQTKIPSSPYAWDTDEFLPVGEYKKIKAYVKQRKQASKVEKESLKERKRGSLSSRREKEDKRGRVSSS